MMSIKTVAAGKSSYDLVDKDKLFFLLPLKKAQVLLDIGCGTGNYSIPIAERLGEKGIVHAIDPWKYGVNELKSKAKSKGISNINAIVGDASKRIPVENESIDVCLMATVLHDLVEDNTYEGTMKEIKRTIRPAGKLVIIEFKKIKPPPGPPMEIRITPKELKHLVEPYGFIIVKTTDIGPFTYLSIFTNDKYQI
jgi:ubiquinone/menaquinone biosynthesis C-methylase UbiE